MLVLNLPFKALMFLTLMRPSLVLFLVLWLKLVKDFLKVRCRLALLPFLISCLIWLDLVASLPLIKERDRKSGSAGMPRSEERFSRNAETELVCRLLLEKKNAASGVRGTPAPRPRVSSARVRSSTSWRAERTRGRASARSARSRFATLPRGDSPRQRCASTIRRARALSMGTADSVAANR